MLGIALTRKKHDTRFFEKDYCSRSSKLRYDLNWLYGKQVEGKKRFAISSNTSLVYEIEVLEMK